MSSITYIIMLILIYSLFLGLEITLILFFYYFQKFAIFFANGLNLGLIYADDKMKWKVHFIFPVSITTETILVLYTNNAPLYSLFILISLLLFLAINNLILKLIIPFKKRQEKLILTIDNLNKKAEKIIKENREIPPMHIDILQILIEYIRFKVKLKRIMLSLEGKKEDKIQEIFFILHYISVNLVTDTITKLLILKNFQNEYLSIRGKTIEITGNFKVISESHSLTEENKTCCEPNVIVLSTNRKVIYYYFIKSDKSMTFSIDCEEHGKYKEIIFLKEKIYSFEDELKKMA